MEGMNKYEMLFAAKAFAKEVNARVKSLEDDCKSTLLDEYEQDGTDRKRSRIFGSKNAYLTVVEGKPSEEAQRFEVTDIDRLTDWLDRENPVETIDRFVIANLCELAEFHFRTTGELPDGCNLLKYETEPTDPFVKLIVNEKAVLDELPKHAQLGEGVSRLLLGDGE